MNRLRRSYSRRAFLKSAGVSAALLPMLEASDARAASPPDGRAPRRFIALCMPNGYTDHYYPSGEGRGWSIADDQGVVPDDHPLRPLLPHRDEITILGGLSIQNARDSFRAYTRAEPDQEERESIGGHACLPHLLTGGPASRGPRVSDKVPLSAGHASLDQYLIKRLPGYADRSHPSLVLRPQPWQGNDQFLSFSGPCLDGSTPNAPPPRDDTDTLYDDLFAAASMNADAVRRMRARRGSVLDLVGAQLEQFRGRVGRADRARIDQHLESVRSVERQIDTIQRLCRPPERLPWSQEHELKRSNEYIPEILRAQMDMIVAAMACDMTRTATLLLSNSHNNNYTFPWLADRDPGFAKPIDKSKREGSAGAPPGDGLRHHHSIAHAQEISPEHRRRKNLVDQWFIAQFAYLLDRLKRTKDADGRPMLETTVVLFTNLQNKGPTHQTHDVSWIIGGSADGALKTGEYWRWAGGERNSRLPTTKVLTSIMQAMGIEEDHFATPEYGGPLGLIMA